MRGLTVSYDVSLDGRSVGTGNGMREVMGAIDDVEHDAAYPSQVEIDRPAAQPGNELFAVAGDEFGPSLIEPGLVDEYRRWVLPAAAGTGAPLFPALNRPLNLRLVTSRASLPES